MLNGVLSALAGRGSRSPGCCRLPQVKSEVDLEGNSLGWHRILAQGPKMISPYSDSDTILTIDSDMRWVLYNHSVTKSHTSLKAHSWMIDSGHTQGKGPRRKPGKWTSDWQVLYSCGCVVDMCKCFHGFRLNSASIWWGRKSWCLCNSSNLAVAPLALHSFPAVLPLSLGGSICWKQGAHTHPVCPALLPSGKML